MINFLSTIAMHILQRDGAKSFNLRFCQTLRLKAKTEHSQKDAKETKHILGNFYGSILLSDETHALLQCPVNWRNLLVEQKKYMDEGVFTIFHQHGHAHESLPTHLHMQHPNKSEDQALMPHLHHLPRLCQNCVHKYTPFAQRWTSNKHPNQPRIFQGEQKKHINHR